MSAGIKLLREQFPNVKGLQPISLAVHSGFEIQRREFVQCLNVYDPHWITIAGDSSPGTVNIIYDSLPNCALYYSKNKKANSIHFVY